MAWTIQILPSALADLRYLPVFAQRIITTAINRQLAQEPLKLSGNLKQLRPNPVAGYELRVHGDYRVLYNADETPRLVTITVIGRKQGNALFVQGKEYRLHHENHSLN